MQQRHYLNHGPRTSFFRCQGLDLLAIENECIRVVIWPEHGADILEFRHKGTDIDVLWKNPNVYPPRQYALDQPHGERASSYDIFHGGWFLSLPNGFFPCDYYGAPLGCHGEIQSVPWVWRVIEESANCVRLRLKGKNIRTPFELTREMVLEKGSFRIAWQDTLYNRCADRLPVAILQHPTFGGPFIEGAELIVKANTIAVPPADRPELSQLEPGYRGDWPMARERESDDLRDCSRVPAFGSSLEHVVILSDLEKGSGGVWNSDLKLGFSLTWDKDFFPYAWSWAAGSGSPHYPLWGNCQTITLQPSTSPLLPFEELLERDEVIWVDGKSSVTTSMNVGFIDSMNEI